MTTGRKLVRTHLGAPNKNKESQNNQQSQPSGFEDNLPNRVTNWSQCDKYVNLKKNLWIWRMKKVKRKKSLIKLGQCQFLKKKKKIVETWRWFSKLQSISKERKKKPREWLFYLILFLTSQQRNIDDLWFLKIIKIHCIFST